MTQMGFVTMVLLPPAIIEDQKLITMLLSACCQHNYEWKRIAHVYSLLRITKYSMQ